MASLPKWRPRTTMIDLYVERDHTRWYWRPLATVSAFLLLTGFIVFAGAFGSKTQLRISQGSLSAIAVVFLTLGYSLSIAIWFLCTSLLFLLDVLFIPCITSCVLGLVNTIYTISIRPTAPLWSTSSISCLTLSIISLTIYTILALLTFHRIGRIRERDITCPRRYSDSSNLLAGEERQTTQWMRLLSQKGADRAGPSQSTFHIDLPENVKNEDDGHETMYLPVPQNIYEGHNWNSRSMPLAERPVEAIQVFTETMFSAPGTEDRGRAIVRPPVITTMRPPTEVLVEGEVRLSEVHPLEREAYLESLSISHSPRRNTPIDTLRRDERSQSRESRRLQNEMTDQRRCVEPEFDVEGVQIVQRIQRVQTDGWPRGNMLR